MCGEGSHRLYAHVACVHSCGISDAFAQVTPCAERAVIGHMRMLHACIHAVFLMRCDCELRLRTSARAENSEGLLE